MHKRFKNLTSFSILYLIAFVIDTYVKVNVVAFPYRYITKTFLILILLLFYIINNKDEKRKRGIVIIALLCFIAGDLFLIGGTTKIRFGVGVLLFAIAKVLYAIRFSNKQDFDVLKLWPFLVFGFAYMCGIMLMVYDNLGDYFAPALLYLFIVMMLAQFAFLRKKEVNIKSFWLVLIGVLLSMFSDSITLLKQFHDPKVLYNHYTIMFFYGLSQYFIIIGLLYENNKSLLKQDKNLS